MMMTMMTFLVVHIVTTIIVAILVCINDVTWLNSWMQLHAIGFIRTLDSLRLNNE